MQRCTTLAHVRHVGAVDVASAITEPSALAAALSAALAAALPAALSGGGGTVARRFARGARFALAAALAAGITGIAPRLSALGARWLAAQSAALAAALAATLATALC